MDWLSSIVPDWTWQQWTIAGVTPMVVVLGVALTILTLPGTWLMVAWALVLKLWQPDMLSWWTFAAIVLLALLGEAIEFFAGAIGAAKAGASRQGAIGSIVGSLAGAIIGIFVPPPVIGSIVCGALGAAAGTIIAERYVLKRAWEESRRAGVGAAIGRMLATLAKATVAVVIATVLSWAVVL